MSYIPRATGTTAADHIFKPEDLTWWSLCCDIDTRREAHASEIAYDKYMDGLKYEAGVDFPVVGEEGSRSVYFGQMVKKNALGGGSFVSPLTPPLRKVPFSYCCGIMVHKDDLFNIEAVVQCPCGGSKPGLHIYSADDSSPFTDWCSECIKDSVLASPYRAAIESSEECCYLEKKDSAFVTETWLNSDGIFYTRQCVPPPNHFPPLRAVSSGLCLRLLVSGVVTPKDNGSVRVGFSTTCGGCRQCVGEKGLKMNCPRVEAAARGDFCLGYFGNEILKLVFKYLKGYTQPYEGGDVRVASVKARALAHMVGVHGLGCYAVSQGYQNDGPFGVFRFVQQKQHQLTSYWPNRPFADPDNYSVNARYWYFKNLESCGESVLLKRMVKNKNDYYLDEFKYIPKEVRINLQRISLVKGYTQCDVADDFYLNKMGNGRYLNEKCECKGSKLRAYENDKDNLRLSPALPRFCQSCGLKIFVGGNEYKTAILHDEEAPVPTRLFNIWQSMGDSERFRFFCSFEVEF